MTSIAFTDAGRKPTMSGRARFVPILMIGLGVVALGRTSSAETSEVTHTFKKIGDLEIKADVYQPEQAKGDGKRPVVVWIHGGALIMGHRESVPKWLLDGSLARGWNVVSIDYRL